MSEGGFHPRLDIVPPSQRLLWDEIASIPDEFVLYGGTAIALHLGHHESVDFDFFGSLALDPTQLTLALPLLAGATVTQREPNTLSCTVDRGGAIKLSFFGLPGLRRPRMPLVSPDNGLKIASLIDLAGMKASALQMRAEAKDYIDIDAILTDGDIDLPTALAAARAINGDGFDPQVTLKSPTFFGDGNLHAVPPDARDRLVRAVGKVNLDRLPSMTESLGP